jgi:hypothetical protein
MPTYSQGPRLLKSAIVAVDLATSRQTTIAFQYNPERLSRTLTAEQAVKVGPLLVNPGQVRNETFDGTRKGDNP